MITVKVVEWELQRHAVCRNLHSLAFLCFLLMSCVL